MVRNIDIVRQKVMIVESIFIASSCISNFVVFLMMKKTSMINAGPAEKAVTMNLIGTMAWNHMGLVGIVLRRKPVTVWILNAQTMEI
jgi:hypothetical protein